MPRSADRTVLIVDDDALVRTSLRDALEPSGYRLLEAVDGEQALRIIEQEQPALVLLDLLMPRVSGLEVLVQARLRSPGSRVVVLSSMSEPGVVEQALRSGACAFIAKPFHPLEILSSVEAALH